jgi:hypothetical protein
VRRPTIRAPTFGETQLHDLGVRAGLLERFARVPNSGKSWSGSASSSPSSGVSNASPPARIEVSDSVFICTPSAPSFTSMPLAFQKRLSVVTKRSYGALMKIWMSMCRPASSSLKPVT